jgi:hypothetical protein
MRDNDFALNRMKCQFTRVLPSLLDNNPDREDPNQLLLLSGGVCYESFFPHIDEAILSLIAVD